MMGGERPRKAKVRGGQGAYKMKPLYRTVLAGVMAVALPAMAQAAQAISTANVNLRAGPSTQYPPVLVVAAGSRVEIFGCLSSANWCDVGFSGYRGWMSGSYLQTQYSSRRIYVDPDYYGQLGIPVVTFRVDNYWDRYYRGRDFYRERDRWRRAPPPPPVWRRDGPPPQFVPHRDGGPPMMRDHDPRRGDFRPGPPPQFDGRPGGPPQGQPPGQNRDPRRPPPPPCAPGDPACVAR